MSDNGIVNIHGKEYQTVAKRVAEFRSSHGDHPLITEIISSGDVVVVKATIATPEGTVISTGYAEEVRGSTNINRTSALENCETSAVGRALAFFGLGGTEIASANEMNDGIIQQAKQEVSSFFMEYNACLREHMGAIMDYKLALEEDDLLTAVGIWYDLPQEAQTIIQRLAPSKGGILTTKERDIQKKNEWSTARNEYFKGAKQ